ncbi:MAG: TetR family transcriptional regulator [Streptosporangiales bacterium]|nr:TetR family transcriptional regulator [Streptosporangiales bacterium]
MALTTPARPRRSQEERRTRTRERLLEATVRCLVELGWAGTSTTEVSLRAGVSRGAQQHHFRTKTELVAAAIEHLLQRQRAEYERAFAALPPDQQGVDAAVDLLWEIYCGPTFTALLELAVASRTDETLRELCADLNQRVVEITVQTFGRLFPGAESLEITPVALRTTLALMTGLALQNGCGNDRRGQQATGGGSEGQGGGKDEVLALLKAFARQLFGETPGGTT